MIFGVGMVLAGGCVSGSLYKLGAGSVIGVPFSGIYLLGFVGTAGREAGRELLMFLPATLLVCGLGLGFIKLGKRLRKA